MTTDSARRVHFEVTFNPDHSDNVEIVRMETMNIEPCRELKGVATVTPDLPGYAGEAWLLEMESGIEYEDYDPHDDPRDHETRFFVVSGLHVEHTGWQCLVFPADKSGEPLSYQHLAGGDGYSHRSAIEELIDRHY